jgi:hypothetical protein
MMAGPRKKGDRGASEGRDFAELQRKLTRATIFEMREDLDDFRAGLDAGGLDYIQALKAFKIQLQEGLADPLVGAVDVSYSKVTIPVKAVEVPRHLARRRRKPRRQE